MHNSISAMILHAGPVAKTVLILLAIESVIGWAIVFNRLVYLRRINAQNRLFRQKFAASTSLAEFGVVEPEVDQSPLAALAQMVAAELKRIGESARTYTQVTEWSFFFDSHISMMANKFESMVPVLIAKADRGVFLLAIISSSAPFLGLLGTVWGIMDSFFQIGNQGSASLPVVAPGIAEALVSTIMGLVVAIPAVLFYNYINHRAQAIEDAMGELKGELLFRLKEELFARLFAGQVAPDSVTARKGRD